MWPSYSAIRMQYRGRVSVEGRGAKEGQQWGQLLRTVTEVWAREEVSRPARQGDRAPAGDFGGRLEAGASGETTSEI